VTDWEGLKTPASVSLFPEKLEFLKEKETEAIPQERLFGASDEGSGSAHPYGCPQTEARPSPSGQAGECLDEREPVPVQHRAEHKTPTPEKIEGFETEKEEISSEGLAHGGEEKKIESEPSLPKAGENPTIISWSAAKQKKKSEPKGFFLWRFLKNLLNR
jgi:hypothetical protein